MALSLTYYQNEYYDSFNRNRWFREEEEEKVKRISGMCYKGDPNFFFVPIAFFPDEKKGEIFASTWKKVAAIKELYINGVKVNKYINRFGAAYHLKPGTYNIKAVYKIDYTYECTTGREFTFMQEDSAETTITIDYDNPYYLALKFFLDVDGIQERNRRSLRINDEYVTKFTYRGNLEKVTLEYLKSTSLSWDEYLDLKYEHYHKPDFNKYAAALNTGSMVYVEERNADYSYFGYKRNGQTQGYGCYVPKDYNKWSYKGMHENGKRSGLGFISLITGLCIFGQFKDGWLNGWGISIEVDSDQVTLRLGNYLNGYLHGKEKVLYIMKSDGVIYEITYEYRNGELIWESDSQCLPLNPISKGKGTYYGESCNGLPHGLGIIENTKGDWQVGEFVKGEWQGKYVGNIESESKITIGNTKYNKLHEMVLVIKFGEFVHYGMMEFGKRVGNGYFYDLKNKNVTAIKWIDGKWYKA